MKYEQYSTLPQSGSVQQYAEPVVGLGQGTWLCQNPRPYQTQVSALFGLQSGLLDECFSNFGESGSIECNSTQVTDYR